MLFSLMIEAQRQGLRNLTAIPASADEHLWRWMAYKQLVRCIQGIARLRPRSNEGYAMSTTNGDFVSWVHFGDLHITGENERNYQDFLALIEQVNTNLAGQIDFALLPGDNADDGSEEQFGLVKHCDRRATHPSAHSTRRP
jgi:hypothetical protein